MYAVYRLLRALVFEEEATESAEEPHAEPHVKPTRKQPLVQEPQKRYFTGEVTSLSENSGMIDQQVGYRAVQL